MSVLGNLPVRVKVYEVGPRDGLQNESAAVPTHAKVEFINLLSAAGLPIIEVTSYVRPGAIPQLADAEEVANRIGRRPGTRYSALVPNLRGMERAAAGRFDEIALFTAASESFSQRNTNASIAESLERFGPVVAEAHSRGLGIRAYVSTAFGCPFEGDVSPATVCRVASDLAALGAEEIVISDTIGVATPSQVEDVINALVDTVPLDRLALHFHDTRGTALANVLTGLLLGVTTFDSSAGGLGGCPYAPGATGNLATEDLVYLLNGLGIESGVDLAAVVDASRYLAGVTGRPPVSRYYRAVA